MQITENKRIIIKNSGTAMVARLVNIVCGFILPAYFISHFGSEVNGLVSSITQFLSLISLCELGVGAVVESSLYKPLAMKDNVELSRIMASAKRFFDKMGIILIVYSLILAIVYPLVVNSSFDFFYTSSLVLIISISLLAQYFIGMRNQILVGADKKSYIRLWLEILIIILNTVISVILIKLNIPLHIVKLSTSLIYVIRPVALNIYVSKHYKIIKDVKYDKEPIKQKWNGVAQHISNVVLTNTDTIVLSLFSDLKNVSVYSVYNMILIGIQSIVMTLTTGTQAVLGGMYAKNEKNEFNDFFSKIEWIMHKVISLIFSITIVLIVPFVSVYTKGVSDVDYENWKFAILIVLSQALYCLRFPYQMVIGAVGHYKQTQNASILEAVINLGTSVLLVQKLGLIGVAIGTLLAVGFKIVYLLIYINIKITENNILRSLKLFGIDILTTSIIVMICKNFVLQELTYYSWVIMAIKVSLLAMLIYLVLSMIFERKKTTKVIVRFLKMFRRR